ncbi:MAG: carbohydrate kinase [Sphingobacteriaceae bacterium]|jgi:sugar (pentulose or hexulose) kinase|nr:carbohydrate kinase [Sphingobacteriaceae bacterium]
MGKIPVIAVFDVGKTNKKLFLFDENYQMVYERSARFTETMDEDGDVCENLESLRLSVFDSLKHVLREKQYDIKAINFSTYGASFVYIDESGEPLTPLYNYLKEYPEELKAEFYKNYGGEVSFSHRTASPVLGSLNSGMQLYRLLKERPQLFEKIKYALHLPQYMSYLITKQAYSDITSIGCHTNLWDFTKNDYHEWVRIEGAEKKLAPILPSNTVIDSVYQGKNYKVGIGLHDSSAALIPYLANFSEPFILLSTGTWCISLNPFNHSNLTANELKNDCLSYMQYEGKPVKASRLFAGYEHERQVNRIASHFNENTARYKTFRYNPKIISKLRSVIPPASLSVQDKLKESGFSQRDLNLFVSDEEAYHQLMLDMIAQQVYSTKLVLQAGVKRIFVDGGFSKNSIYMHLLAAAFPEVEVFAASMAQATAMGTALAIHKSWNNNAVPSDIIELKYYSVNQPVL